MKTSQTLPDHHSVAEACADEPTKEELAAALEDLVSRDMCEGDFMTAIDQEGSSEKLSALIKGLLDARNAEDTQSARIDMRDYMNEILTAYYQKREELVKERAGEMMDEETV